MNLTKSAEAAVHAGELTPGIIATISGASGGLARMAATAVPNNPRAGILAAVLISSASLWIWVWSSAAWSREGAFALFVGWGVIVTATYGIFQGSDPAKISGSINTLTAGRMGTSNTKE